MKWGTGLERYFALLKILEIGSFTKAADAMGYSQSAVSQMVQSLESELSLKLLYRSRNGIKLTRERPSFHTSRGRSTTTTPCWKRPGS